MKKIKFLKTLFCCVFVFFSLFAGISNASDVGTSEHVKIARNFLNETLTLLENGNKSEQQKRQIIVNRYVENVNFTWNAKSALGRAFLQLSADEQKEYINEYTKFLIYSWLPKLNYNKNSDMTMVVSDKSVKLNNTDENVTLVITMKDGTKYEVLLRTRITKEGKFEILNLYVEGIDLASSYRAQFTSLMEQNKNDPRSVIKYLKEQNKEKKKTIDFKIPNK